MAKINDSRELALGVDTSNYKTSVAVVNRQGELLYNCQSFLKVKKGERGLRQSEALFQHIQQLPEIIGQAMAVEAVRENLACVSVSSAPRPVEGSYMPVFTAGVAVARSVSSALGLPLYTFSHQEGHIEAVKFFSPLRDTQEPFICFHFSGGTTEAVYVDESRKKFEIVGGSKDLAFGQVLDRIGVAMGLDFPCGNHLDRLAAAASGLKSQVKGARVFSPIKVKDAFVNLSGTETQGQRLVQSEKYQREEIAEDLLFVLSKSVMEMTLQLKEKYRVNNFIFAGGVSASRYMKKYLVDNLDSRINLVFGEPQMASDNAIGTALLGGRKIWL